MEIMMESLVKTTRVSKVNVNSSNNVLQPTSGRKRPSSAELDR